MGLLDPTLELQLQFSTRTPSSRINPHSEGVVRRRTRSLKKSDPDSEQEQPSKRRASVEPRSHIFCRNTLFLTLFPALLGNLKKEGGGGWRAPDLPGF